MKMTLNTLSANNHVSVYFMLSGSASISFSMMFTMKLATMMTATMLTTVEWL